MGFLTSVEEHSDTECQAKISVSHLFQESIFSHIALKYVQPLQFRRGSSTDQWNQKVVLGKPI